MHLIADNSRFIDILEETIRTYKENGIKDIVILTPGRIDYSAIAERIEESDGYGTKKFFFKFDGHKYPVSTCIRFKGLEADAIVMIDLNKQSFLGKKGLEFYVGASRAKLRLDMICELSADDYYDVVHELDSNAPRKNDPNRMRRVLGNTFSADVVVE